MNVAYDLDDAGFQPYWIAYAAAHQRTPQEQFDADRDDHGFACWLAERWGTA